MVVQITTAIRLLSRCDQPHLLCSCVSGRRVPLCWLLHFQHPLVNQEENTTHVLIMMDGTVECAGRRICFPPGFRSLARCFL
jgi:hypothetical protein